MTIISNIFMLFDCFLRVVTNLWLKSELSTSQVHVFLSSISFTGFLIKRYVCNQQSFSGLVFTWQYHSAECISYKITKPVPAILNTIHFSFCPKYQTVPSITILDWTWPLCYRTMPMSCITFIYNTYCFYLLFFFCLYSLFWRPLVL